VLRVGAAEGSLIISWKYLARPIGPAMSRWDGGCDDLVVSAGGALSAPRCTR
jgi:hypothetical protein